MATPRTTSLARDIAAAVGRAQEDAALPETRLALAYANPDRFVGAEEASAITGLSVPTLAVYRCTGRLPADTKAGHTVRYRVRTLLRYIEKYRSES